MSIKAICVAVGIFLIIGGVLGFELIGDIGVIPSGVWTLPCFLGLMLIAGVIEEGIQSIMDEIERKATYYKKIDEFCKLFKNKDEKGGERSPTADVVPKSEVDALIYKLESLLCHATGNRLSKYTYDLQTMEKVVTDYIQESYDEGYKDGGQEVAREVLDEAIKAVYSKIDLKIYNTIEGKPLGDGVEFGKQQAMYDVITMLAELKKKYMEGKK